MTNYHQCCNCPNKATWYYMPYSPAPMSRYFCDNCVGRGCSCWWISNIEYEYPPDSPIIVSDGPFTYDEMQIVKIDGGYEHRDLCGQQLPCVEYDYCKNGFEIEEKSSDEEMGY